MGTTIAIPGATRRIFSGRVNPALMVHQVGAGRNGPVAPVMQVLVRFRPVQIQRLDGVVQPKISGSRSQCDPFVVPTLGEMMDGTNKWLRFAQNSLFV